MYENDLNDRCPICYSGSFDYYINGYGALVKRCTGCGHFMTTKSVTTDKTTFTEYTQLTNTNDIISKKVSDKLTINHDINPKTLEIKCDSITLKQNDISICFCSEKDIKQFDSIIINGIKFKKVEEDNDC